MAVSFKIFLQLQPLHIYPRIIYGSSVLTALERQLMFQMAALTCSSISCIAACAHHYLDMSKCGCGPVPVAGID